MSILGPGNTRTFNSCVDCCPGMHDSFGRHPPPFLLFTLSFGSLCGGCFLKGYLAGFMPSQDNAINLQPGVCMAGDCPDIVYNGSTDPDCKWIFDCVTAGGNHYCQLHDDGQAFLPWKCNNFCCSGSDLTSCICQYTPVVDPISHELATDLSQYRALGSRSDAITLLCGVDKQGHDRWKCFKSAEITQDFYVQIKKNAIHGLNPSCPDCSNPTNDTCPICDCSVDEATFESCVAYYGPDNFIDGRPFCDPTSTDCNAAFGVGCWQPDAPTGLYVLYPNCKKDSATYTGCNPCPYCDPEKDDCNYTSGSGLSGLSGLPGSGLGSGGSGYADLYFDYGPPCNPCAWNQPHAPTNPRNNACPGCVHCSDCPGCMDCATFDQCNKEFAMTFYGPCGMVMHVWAP